MKKQTIKGFTLAELLIVVAIIAVLVGISIPVFSSQLEKARVAVDQANVRSAKAAAVAEYINESGTQDKTYIFNGSVAILKENDTDIPSIQGYGKSTKNDTDGTKTGAAGTPKDAYVEVTIRSDGGITAKWIGGTSSSGGTVDQVTQDNINAIVSGKSGNGIEWLNSNKDYRNRTYANWTPGESILSDDKTTIYTLLPKTIDDNFKQNISIDSKEKNSVSDFVTAANNNSTNNAEFVKVDTTKAIHDFDGSKTYERGDVVKAKGYKGDHYYMAISSTNSTPYDNTVTLYWVEIQ